MLIAALTFGQVGSGFLHNKHDAHEAIADHDNGAPVLVKHGEHCKVCSVDLFNQFIATGSYVDLPREVFQSLPSTSFASLIDAEFFLSSGRAPPVIA